MRPGQTDCGEHTTRARSGRSGVSTAPHKYWHLHTTNMAHWGASRASRLKCRVKPKPETRNYCRRATGNGESARSKSQEPRDLGNFGPIPKSVGLWCCNCRTTLCDDARISRTSLVSLWPLLLLLTSSVTCVKIRAKSGLLQGLM